MTSEQAQGTPASILVVEDERLVARDIGRTLVAQGYQVAGYAYSAREAIEKAQAAHPDLVLMDIHLEGAGDGTEAAFEIRQKLGIPVVYLTAFSDAPTLARARRANPFGYVLKPFTPADLTCAVEMAIHQQRVERARTASASAAMPGSAPTPAEGSPGDSAAPAARQSRSALEQENADLKAFGIALVHELHAPLSTLSAASELMARKFGAALPSEGVEMLELMRDTTQRVRRLMNDVHRLSSIEHQLIYDERVDLGMLVTRVLEELRLREPERDVRVDIAPNLLVRGDARLLQIALENMVRNAWKFTAARARATISIGRTSADGEDAFYIQDDGVGFDARLSNKLAKPFVRLHYVVDFEGTGLGLYIARRIIERHGGRMWARSQSGFGASFFFTLPRSSATPEASKLD